MKTYTAYWDYNHPLPVASYNDHCPECGHGCFSSEVPGGIIYSCPKCYIVRATLPELAWLEYYRANQIEIEQANQPEGETGMQTRRFQGI